MNVDLLILLAAWLAYFGLHSLLAALPVKRWVAKHRAHWMPGYRLMFNSVAVLAVLPVLWLTHSIDAPLLWRWEGWQRWLAEGLALFAIAGFLWSTRWYDGGEFLGLRQLREGVRTVEDQERLHISPLHRFVRHPWYSFGLVLIWTRELNAPWLLTAVAISVYFVIGSRLEEAKLIEYHGEAYRRYRARVPALIPSPWRWLSAREADDIAAGRD